MSTAEERARAERFAAAVLAEGLPTTQGNLLFHMRSLFSRTPLQGARLLDIGGGSGICTLWAAAMGAAEAVCLEPEAAGSTEGSGAVFARMRNRLGVGDAARLESTTVQAYETDRPFDVILLHNSINHLDEDACIHLLDDPEKRARYEVLFRKLASWSKPGARLIACDCARRNFFADLGLKSPFARDIEWHKHQSPRTWAELLSEAGFTEPRVRWTSYNSLRAPGRFMTGNALVAYFTRSHFHLEMRRKR